MQADDETTFRPSDVARELGVTTNTVRNWTRRYNEFLSDGTRPEGRQERAFSRRDLAVLHYVNAHVNEGYTHDYIAKRLPETTFSDDEVILPADVATESPQTPQEPLHEPLQPTAMVDANALAPLLTALQSNQVKGEQIHVIRDDVKRHDRDIAQLRNLVIIGLFMLALIAVLLVLLVVILR